MKSLVSVGSFLWALVLVFLAFVCTGNGFKQDLWFYDAEDNDVHFESSVSDTSDLASFLNKVTSYCRTGMWAAFNETDFTSNTYLIGIESDTEIACYNFTDAASIKSIRHFGADDTDTDALSLYDGENWSGKEIFVTARAHIGITDQIVDVAGTGTSDWMLFEGMNLDGNSWCYEVPFSAGWYLNYDHVSTLGLTTVGSVFKGCDAQEIQNYKMLHSLAL